MRYSLIQYSVVVLMLWGSPIATLGQEQDSVAGEKKVKRPAYLDISFGISHSYFRDFATSPLFYSGQPLYVALSHIEMDEKRASEVALSYSFGDYRTTYNEHISVSEVNTIALNYLELFQLKKLSESRFNVKVGGQFNSLVNIRYNSDLSNNRTGADIISTLFASASATIDFNKKRRTSSLSFGLNIGLVNSSYRNSFAYTNSSFPTNENKLFADYEFKIFRGFRMNSALDYTLFLRNNNAIQFSYLWDAFKTGGHHDNFEMATHTLKCSLLFRIR